MTRQADAESPADSILGSARSALLVDWPSRDVPETLARAGYDVWVRGGPAPDAYTQWELDDGEIITRPLGHPPEHADLVYSHRTLSELPGIVALAASIGAGAVWCQSGLSGPGARDPRGCWQEDETSRSAREIVESAGLQYVDDVYIADAVRARGRAT